MSSDPTVERQKASALDPLVFAQIYLPHHLKGPATGGEITFSEAHISWGEFAKEWIVPPSRPMEARDAFVGPREIGKSTWFFLILPLWAAAFGYVGFAAAFANSGTQAETHLRTFKHELDRNALLRKDFPNLCAPARRPRGQQIADNAGMLVCRSGFIFAARGIDAGNLGMKVGELRPDLIILDDVEPGEANYSAYQMENRLRTIRDVVFPLNINARVVIVGTVTMPGSIIHQLVRSVRGGEIEEWINEEKIEVHFSPPILTNEDGTERSLWPARWPMSFLDEYRHTRAFAKNYANDPMGTDGDYWSESDFQYGDVPGVTKRLLSVDPSVTTKKMSDPTGLAVVGYAPAVPDGRGGLLHPARCLVERSESVKLTGGALRDHCLRIIEQADETGRPIGGVLIETNQGGDLWKRDVFHAFPVPVRDVHQAAKKEVRAAESLAHYQRKRVWHLKAIRSLEEQQVSFPAAPHDDEVDAVGTAVNYFLTKKPTKHVGMRSESYA